MTPPALFFWILAAIKLIVTFQIQLLAARNPNPENVQFSKSQRMDDWLALAIMFIAVRCDAGLAGWLSGEIKNFVLFTDSDTKSFSFFTYLFCTVATGWLIKRAGQRLHLIKGRK